MIQNSKWFVAAKQYPSTTVLIVLSAFGWIMVSIDYSFSMRNLSFILGGDYWRLLTPIFLHFGIAHFAFNSIWLSMLGSRIESLMGPIHLILLVVISGLISNLSQFWWSGAPNFGGMSGVVYSLIGYMWIVNILAPRAGLELPKGVFGFMIGWLFLCMTPLLPAVFGVGIANAAHVGGLFCGMITGLAFGIVMRFRRTLQK
jgi:GlpG protein